MYNTTCPHLFLKIFIDFLTSTLLREQNTTLLSKVRRIFFSNFVAFSENPNFKMFNIGWKKNPWCWLLKGSFVLDHAIFSVRCTWLMIFQLHTWKTRVYSHVPSLNIQSCIKGPICSTFRFENSIFSLFWPKEVHIIQGQK